MTEPLPSFRFMVTLDAGDAYLPPKQAALLKQTSDALFQEVRGLGAELEVTAYAEGGLNDYVHQLPVRHSWGRISFRTGVAQLPELWNWYTAGLTQSLGARRDGAIWLLTPSGDPAVSWEFRGGIAVKWTGPELDAMQNAVAVEGLEVAHHGINQVRSPEAER